MEKTLSGFFMGFPDYSFAIAPRHTGVFCCTSMLGRAPGQTNLPESVYQSPVQGVAIRIAWSAIEPQDGVYDWTLLDAELNRAAQYNKKISIAVLSGACCPSWIYSAPYNVPSNVHGIDSTGAPGVDNCRIVTIPLPWDATYILLFNRMIAALTQHLKDIDAYNRVVAMKLTGVTRYTSEFRSQHRSSAQVISPTCSWTDDRALLIASGYTPQKIIDAFMATTAAIASNFPKTHLVVEVLNGNEFPLIGSDGTAIPNTADPKFVNIKSVVYGQLRNLYPGRCSASWNGLQLNGTPMATTLQSAENLGLTVALQTNQRAGTGASCPVGGVETPCTEEGYRATLQIAIDRKVQIIEVFPNDALAFPGVIGYAQEQMRDLHATNLGLI